MIHNQMLSQKQLALKGTKKLIPIEKVSSKLV